ncbi:MAG: glucose 1-dehydrogenase [Chloroflexi bacterium]|nr:glucose 1-dehydrogenase [Chloroflexota bacterium]
MLDLTAVSLKGKVAIVTGGGGGIGRSVSETFAAYGAKVVVAERDAGRAHETVAAIAKRGGQALASVVDVQEKEQVAQMKAAAVKEFGKVDILVNNVGDFLGIKKNFIRTSEEDWEALYRINLKQVFYCTHAIAPLMIEQGKGGSIINVSTIEAFRGIPGGSIYATFKGGITQFTKSIALELAKYQIRVNAIAPETTETLQVQAVERVPPEQRSLIPYWIPLGRYGDPDDLAGVAVFLASDLSRWVTGITVNLDGGAYAAGGFYRQPSGGWTSRPPLA